MSQGKLYHNPRCSKSRQTLELLKSRDINPEIILYLDAPPSEAELGKVIKMLGISPRELLRKKESEYKEQNLADDTLKDKEIIQAMVQFPRLIERPIFINDGKAAIGRPPENVLELI
ncbi:MAG: arsenate reductase (glutaredoxin) [Gammaproteobacteria bacterium]|nr:MAG: arsenate reductase (glutaredoxin) [Gammaproteobacteria bacterium]